MPSDKHYISSKPCKEGHLLFYISTGKCVRCTKIARQQYKEHAKANRVRREMEKPFLASLPGEIWLDVVGYEGRYKVSNLGRVRSVPHLVPYKAGTTKFVHGKMLRPGPSKTGHLTVSLGRCNSVGVHRIVLEAFVGPCPDGMECCHGDGIAFNNVLPNLRWDTRSANLLDAVRHGAKKVGEEFSGSKLKNSDIPIIRHLLASRMTVREIAGVFGVTEGAINNIKYERCWKHIAGIAA